MDKTEWYSAVEWPEGDSCDSKWHDGWSIWMTGITGRMTEMEQGQNTYKYAICTVNAHAYILSYIYIRPMYICEIE